MRMMQAVAACAVLLGAPPAFGQAEWIEFTDRAERFMINFPGQPAIRETTYPPQRGAIVPAKIYTVTDGPRRYSMTVVNLATLRQPSDVKGSVAWEAWNFRKRGGAITYDAYAQVDAIEGHQMHITHADATVSYVGIYVHERRLYVLEARVPASNTTGAVHFQQSLFILDADGKRIRYELDANGDRLRRIANLDGIC